MGATKKHEDGKQKIFTPNISPSAAGFLFLLLLFIQTRVCVFFYHPNYSHQCQGDSLEYPTRFKRDQKYSLSKEQNQWHKSTIVHSSFLSWTIPLYCVFIIPLKWVYRVGQVEHSHAWTYFTVCLVDWVQKSSSIDIHGAASMRCDRFFFFFGVCVCACVCGNTRAATNLNCSYCLQEGFIVPLAWTL